MVFSLGEEAVACTSAIISGKLTPSGRTLLWKNRDTSNIDNVVEYIEPSNGHHGYVALFNADDTKREQAWIGYNDAGFAVMNTASYNIKDDNVAEKYMDREGFLMTRALQLCESIDDFANLLDTLPRPMGVEANFGVTDYTGNGAFFETNNHSFVRYDLADAPDGILIRTNYSKSGRPEEGFGFVREKNAEYLLSPHVAAKDITPEILTEEVSKSFWHHMKGRDCLAHGDKWIIDQDFIPRLKSTATVVIEGAIPKSMLPTPEEVAEEWVMWIGIGYPPCAEIEAALCREGGVPEGLRATTPEGHSRLADEAKERRNRVFPITKGNGEKYIEVEKLQNPQATGYLQVFKEKNLKKYEDIRKRSRK